MKKIIALLCAFVMLTVCCITANAATLTSIVPDEEIAKEHGYTLNYYRKDGWRTPYRYVDENNCVPNQISIISNKELDISQYKTDELADFYGIEILHIHCFLDTLSAEMRELYLKKCPNKYEYTIITAEFYTREEAAALFAEYDFITSVYLEELGEDDAELEPQEEVAGDVNFDNVFDSMDYLLIKRAFFGEYPEANLYCNRGDLNNNLKIDSMDYLMLKRAFFNQYVIEQ